MTGSRCSITSIRKVDKDLWCLSLAAFRLSVAQKNGMKLSRAKEIVADVEAVVASELAEWLK
jgi:hypothetical protein